jgi:pimeloyl-ACP methyl ester carboxylesterase
MADFVEAFLDEAGIGRARIAGNSLGGFVALQLAERGRAQSVVALAPAGGWPAGDDAPRRLLGWQRQLRAVVKAAVPHVSTSEARLHQMLAVARCPGSDQLIDVALRSEWRLDAERIECPVRIVWGTDDELLPWPAAASRFRAELPQADWIELDGVGHYPQLEAALETAELIAGF